MHPLVVLTFGQVDAYDWIDTIATGDAGREVTVRRRRGEWPARGSRSIRRQAPKVMF